MSDDPATSRADSKQPSCAGAAPARRAEGKLSSDAYFDVVSEVSRFFSHSLGNLLTGLSLTLDMLAMSKPGDARAPQLVARAVGMMESLCSFKEAWSGLGDNNTRGFEAREPESLIHEVLDQARLSSEFMVSVNCDPQTPALICHPGLLTSALQYLVRNAVDAMPQGGSLGIDVRPNGDLTKITVWDDGPGVPVELRSKIFYEPVTTKPYGGGIGLMLVAMIARRVHHGDVHFVPRAPQGCGIELTLPSGDPSVARTAP